MVALGLFVVFMALVAAAAVVMLLVSLYKWAKEDAGERGMDNPVMWGLIVALVPNLIGLMIYLVVRSTNPPAANCTSCGRKMPKYAGFCPACGSAQAAPVVALAEDNVEGKKKPTRHLVRGAICFGIALVLFVAATGTVAISGLGEYDNMHESVSMVYMADNDMGTMMRESRQQDEYSLRFRTWDGERTGHITASGTLVCEVDCDRGELWVELTFDDSTVQVTANDRQVYELDGVQRVEYRVVGINAEHGSVEIELED